MRNVDVRLTADAVRPQEVPRTLCVVIDVLRASTTIVTALANGSAGVIPVESPQEAREIARERNCLLGGERDGLRIEGFDFGNSPLEYDVESIDGRLIAFTTTNGTRAIRACVQSDELIVACFLNVQATLRLLRQRRNDILIVCAGTRGAPSLEDTVCAGIFLEALQDKRSPEAEEAVSLWNLHKGNLTGMMKTVSDHGQHLVGLGFEKDIELACALDRFTIVAIREDDTIIRRSS